LVDTSRYFPIQSATACKLKWSWSTLYLNGGHTASCHRSSFSALTAENFDNFHNTNSKVYARQQMLEGQWPTGGCEYCQGVENNGGFSDRMLHNSIPGLVSKQLEPNLANPSVLEVYFNNTCNLGCLYCNPELSSTTAQENLKFGNFKHSGVDLPILPKKNLEDLEPKFWQWMERNFHTVERFHFLGGEPFYQRQLDTLLDFFSNNSNPNLEFNIVTNLMVKKDKLEEKIQTIKHLLAKRKIRRFDITASIDCWGPEQEYVRYGLDLNQWAENFSYLLNQRWITLNINQTISALTIKTMPDLLEKLQVWRQQRPIGHFFSVTEPGPSYLRPNIFGPGVFDKDFEHVLNLMPNTTENEQRSYQYMSAIAKEIESHNMDKTEIDNLFIFLSEKDRRRGTNWSTTFPWLKDYVL
jgi:organic radical activating enzyme